MFCSYFLPSSYIYSCFLLVELEDKAVATLVTHFTQVIDDIVEDKWSHLPTQWVSEKKQKLYVISPVEIKAARTLDQDPQPVFFPWLSSSWSKTF